MLGDTEFLPGALISGDDQAPSISQEDGAKLLLGFATPIPAYDKWGAIQIPAVGQAPTTPAGDPCIRTILDFIQAFVCTDKNVTAAWSPVFPQQPPILKTFQHNPADIVFNTRDLPSLFMWRESATQDYIGEDWLRETTMVKALWVFPLQGIQEQQRLRDPFVNALIKAIVVGIERGRTPSFISPGDTDPQAATQGSLFYTQAGFECFTIRSWKRAKLQVVASEGAPVSYPAVELTFELFENLEYGLGRFPENDGSFVTLINEAGVITDAGPMQH